ncbi:MAG: hypothetical protein KGH87_08215 [Thaumarchaeota archaeon]|nr:hypothetical protein [Nitrososphaerota archaeon]MDE1839888.1 hypothetical protein [Nitrososphaerota archaeon]
MTNKKLLITSLVAAIVAISAIGAYSVTTPSLLNGYSTDYTDVQGVRHISYGDPSQDNIPYHGMVTYVGKHQDGTTFLIANVHNTRTVQGINCAEQFLFNGLSTGPLNTNGTNVCGFQAPLSITSAKFNGFRFIGLINGSGTAIMNGSDTYTTSKIGGSRASSHDGIISVGLTNQGSPANSTVAGTSIYNQLTITSPAFTFTGDAVAGTTIRGAVLLNATSGTPALFAENAFTGVALANTDTITITWTITLS